MKRSEVILVILAIIIAISGLVWLKQLQSNSKGFQLKSTAISNGGKIDSRFTCDGSNINPPFQLLNAPKNTKALAIIVEDINLPKDFRKQNWQAHWIVWNIPIESTQVFEGVRPAGVVGRNLFGNFGYSGPCPPFGQSHRYSFTLYALSQPLTDLNSESKFTDVKKAIEQATINRSKITASYFRPKK